MIGGKFFFITFARDFCCRDGGMVDTRDLKSLDQEWLCGFESRSRHKKHLRPVICLVAGLLKIRRS